MKKKKEFKLNPHLQSAIESFLAGFLPPFVMQLQSGDFTSMEFSVIVGFIVLAVKSGFKYGLTSLVKWFAGWVSGRQIK